MSYTSGSQQALSAHAMPYRNGNSYGNGNGYTNIQFNRQPIAYQSPAANPHQFAPAHLQQVPLTPYSPSHHPSGHLPRQHSLQSQNLPSPQNFQSPNFPGQNLQGQRRPGYNSYGSQLNNLNNLGIAMQPEQPMPIPRFMNPYAVPSAKMAPVRAHQDYLKYAQPNVNYNPYQSQFSPTLMARPDIHLLAKPEAVPNFQKRDRSPYNSVSDHFDGFSVVLSNSISLSVNN